MAFDQESQALIDCMNILASLQPEARVRVFNYLNDRFQGGAASVTPAKATTTKSAGLATAAQTGGKRGPKPGSTRSASEASEAAAAPAKRGPKPGKKGSKRNYEALDIDLRPVGKTSLADFYKEYEPKKFPDQHLVFVYYFTKVYGLPAVSLNHIFTAFKHTKAKLPKDLYQNLLQINSRFHHFNTADTDAITLTPEGEKAFGNLAQAAAKK